MITQLNSKLDEASLRQEILDRIKEYYELAFGGDQKFLPGRSKISYAGRVFDAAEVTNLVDASLDFWLTYGRFSKRFEDQLADFLNVKHCLLVNSGSSANLLAFMCLTSYLLGERRIERGDEVITVAACFPTTVAPIVQYGAIPVFVDVELETANVDVSELRNAIGPRTKAVMLAHTLGNPFKIDDVQELCRKYNLWLIEDNCDALGARFDGKLTGTFGDIGTSSFYPPHHITMGEGGAIYSDQSLLAKIILSMRDWGRDCICPSGVDNFCGRRFDRDYTALPHGYDHKYVYSHFGYNLKVSDMQAAIGCAQLEKLPGFIEARQRNWRNLREQLDSLQEVFVLPEATKDSEPSWFGFLITLRDNTHITRDQIVGYLESRGIQTRMLFAGNLTKHPCFDEMRKTNKGFRVIGELANTDAIMHRSFWVGVYPGITNSMMQFMAETIIDYVMKVEVK